MRGVPRLEHLEDAGDDLVEGIVDEDDALLTRTSLVGEGDLAHLLRREVELLLDAVAALELGHDGVEEVAVDAVRHGPRLQEAPVAVPGRPPEVRLVGERLGELVVEADVDEGGHEAGHGDGRARADGEQEGAPRVAQAQPRLPLQLAERRRAMRCDGVVVERPVRHRRHGAEELRGEDEALGHVVPVRGHLLEAEPLEAQGHLVVGAGLGLWMGETRRSGS